MKILQEIRIMDKNMRIVISFLRKLGPHTAQAMANTIGAEGVIIAETLAFAEHRGYVTENEEKYNVTEKGLKFLRD